MKIFTFSSGCHPSPLAQRQKGIALVVGLVILVILALLGTAAYSVATQEERMAGNARDHARAFQAAEYALRECEHAVLQSPVFDPNGVGSPKGMFTANTNGYWVGDTQATSWPAQYPLNALSGVNTQPSCIAEDFQKGKITWSNSKNLIPHTARVTAVGYGITTGTKVTLVSYVNYFSTTGP